MFWLSTGTFSSDYTGALLAKLLEWLHVTLSPEAFSALHTLIRKCAHLTEYAIFAVLLYRSFGDSGRLRWRPRLATWSVAVAAGYSLTDEFHQGFVPGRGPSLLDCGIDTTGAAIAMLLLYTACAAFEKRTPAVGSTGTREQRLR
jgi:VanZ family protein